MTSQSSTSGIDAVITWVDGNDASLRAKRESYMHSGREARNTEIAGNSRFDNKGEIFWCVASINRFAPWIRKIWIVTDSQRPAGLEKWTAENFENPIPMEVVDHKVIFRGYECLLPTFNSRAIETMVWRIPGLADRYLYFNDDMFLASPNAISDRFTEDGKLVNYGHPMNVRATEFLFHLKHRQAGLMPPGYKNGMTNAAKLVGSKKFIYHQHSVVAQDRRILEDFYTTHEEEMIRNASYRFRNAAQHRAQSLCLILAAQQGKLVNIHDERTAFFKPSVSKPEGYMARKMQEADNHQALQGCINSLDRGNEKQFLEFKEWITKRLGIHD